MPDWQTYVIPEPNSGCWLWLGPVDGKGYAKHVKGNTHRSAHRVAWEAERGSIPPGMLVCHHCDNRLCVNPDHLFLGTQFDNVQDQIRKGRHFRFGQTHCLRGHEFTADNTYFQQNKNSISRICKRCVIDGNRRRRMECK